jgi:hypothetical protein
MECVYNKKSIPKQLYMSESVFIVKFLFPDSHSDISDSLLPSILANFFCEIFLAFNVSVIFPAISILSLVRRSVSSSIDARILVNTLDGFLLVVIFLTIKSTKIRKTQRLKNNPMKIKICAIMMQVIVSAWSSFFVPFSLTMKLTEAAISAFTANS